MSSPIPRLIRCSTFFGRKCFVHNRGQFFRFIILHLSINVHRNFAVLMPRQVLNRFRICAGVNQIRDICVAQLMRSYGVWQEKQLYEKVSIGVARSSFLIDEQGVIEKASFKVKPILTQRSCWVSKKCVSVVISGDERTSPDMHQESLHAGK